MGDVSKSNQDPKGEAPPRPAVRALNDPIDLERDLRYGWRLFKRNKGDAILAPLMLVGILLGLMFLFFIPFALMLGSRAIGNPLFPKLGADLEAILWQTAMMAVFMPAVAWLTLGQAKVFLALARRKKPHARDMFPRGNIVLVALIAFVVSNVATQLSVVLLFFGSLAVQMILSLNVYYIVDKGLGPLASLHASIDACWSWRTVAKLLLIYLALQLGILITCYVGMVVLMPWIFLVLTTVYLRLSSRLTCVHCGVKVPAWTTPCPACQSEPTVLPEGPPDSAKLDVRLPARKPPGWINPMALSLLVPLVLVGMSPWGGVMYGASLAPRYLGIHALLGVGIGLGSVLVPTIGALLLLQWQYTGFRAVSVDEAGAVFGATERWEGIRVRWRRVKGFWITGTGAVRLEIKRRPWTRWVGPVIPTTDRDTHDLVVALEERGLYNLAG